MRVERVGQRINMSNQTRKVARPKAGEKGQLPQVNLLPKA